ncbi:Uncharacterized protein APZ42_030004, partial [Daphnia magna]
LIKVFLSLNVISHVVYALDSLPPCSGGSSLLGLDKWDSKLLRCCEASGQDSKGNLSPVNRKKRKKVKLDKKLSTSFLAMLVLKLPLLPAHAAVIQFWSYIQSLVFLPPQAKLVTLGKL